MTTPSSVGSLDAMSYLAANPDLAVAFGTDTTAAERHYITNGYGEGRSTTFDALGYLAANRDLAVAFGTDTTAAERHYITNGYGEGRSTTFDALGYLAVNRDLAAAFGTDTAAAERHYITNGYGEGRSTTFDALGYLAANPDLTAAFGTDTTAAERHYITNGYGEGRSIVAIPTVNFAFVPSTGLDTQLTAGGSLTGQISHLETQYRQIRLDAGTTYTFLSHFDTPGRNTLYLEDSNHRTVASDSDYDFNDKTFVYTPTVGGLYTLSVNAIDQGTYTLSAAVGDATLKDEYAGDTSTKARLSVGGSIGGAIQQRGDEDWFIITLAADTYYRFNVKTERASSVETAPTVQLITTDDKALQGMALYNGEPGKDTVVKSTEAGQYYLRLFGSFYQGGYTLSAALGDDYGETAATAGRLAVGGSTSAHGDYANDLDRFAVTLDAGSTYAFSAGGPVANELTLYDPSGKWAAAGSGLSSYTAPRTGTYYLQHRTVNWGQATNGWGDYTVAASRLSSAVAMMPAAAGMLAAF